MKDLKVDTEHKLHTEHKTLRLLLACGSSRAACRGQVQTWGDVCSMHPHQLPWCLESPPGSVLSFTVGRRQIRGCLMQSSQVVQEARFVFISSVFA